MRLLLTYAFLVLLLAAFSNEARAEIRLSSIDTLSQPPSSTEMYQNSPNPFGEETTIDFQLAEKARVSFSIYTITGQEVEKGIVDTCLTAGKHRITWRPSQPTSGIYFYKLTAGPYAKTMKMTLLR